MPELVKIYLQMGLIIALFGGVPLVIIGGAAWWVCRRDANVQKIDK